MAVVRSLTWMKFNPGDYRRDTSHLSTLEHGAYFLLIMDAWTRGGLLPRDSDGLRIITVLGRREWKKIEQKVMGFFVLTPDGYRHKRIDAELDNAVAYMDQKRDAGRASSEKRNQDGEHKTTIGGNTKKIQGGFNGEDGQNITDHEKIDQPIDFIENVLNGRCIPVGTETGRTLQRDANETPNAPPPHLQEQEHLQIPNRDYKESPPTPKPKTASTTGGRSVSEDDFETFWKAYPRRVGKGSARRALARAVRLASVGEIVLAIQHTRFDHREKFIPHPATWLNDQRWLDENTRGDAALRAVGLSDNGDLLGINDEFPDIFRRIGGSK